MASADLNKAIGRVIEVHGKEALVEMYKEYPSVFDEIYKGTDLDLADKKAKATAQFFKEKNKAIRDRLEKKKAMESMSVEDRVKLAVQDVLEMLKGKGGKNA